MARSHIRIPLLIASLAALGVPGASAAQTTEGPFGADGDTYFEDLCDVAELRINAGWWIDGIQVVCRDGSEMPQRGKTGGGRYIFTLEPGETIRQITGSAGGAYGSQVYSLQIHTSARQSPVYGDGGPEKGQEAFVLSAAGRQLSGILGTTSSRGLSSIGIQHSAITAVAVAPSVSAIPTTLPSASPATSPPTPNTRPVVIGPPVRWVAWVKTGGPSGAGTDANIMLYVRSGRGDLGPLLLDRSGYDDFENGDLDRYPLGSDFGGVTAVLLHNDGANAGADWYVEWVCVGPEDQGECKDYPSTYFRFDNWLPGNAQTVWQTH
jgi:hypothetical protein